MNYKHLYPTHAAFPGDVLAATLCATEEGCEKYTFLSGTATYTMLYQHAYKQGAMDADEAEVYGERLRDQQLFDRASIIAERNPVLYSGLPVVLSSVFIAGYIDGYESADSEENTDEHKPMEDTPQRKGSTMNSVGEMCFILPDEVNNANMCETGEGCEEYSKYINVPLMCTMLYGFGKMTGMDHGELDFDAGRVREGQGLYERARKVARRNGALWHGAPSNVTNILIAGYIAGYELSKTWTADPLERKARAMRDRADAMA